VRAAFAHRRKTLVNSLHQAFAAPLPAEALSTELARLGIPPRARAEDVPPDAWRALAAALGTAEPARAGVGG
jgi:16S rRNA (adenine1518-N6/adenine1519-N6)-dimethyltransferase